MDRVEECKYCGARIAMKFNSFPGSCTESESYDCPNCGQHLFSSRDSGFYSDLKVIPDKQAPQKHKNSQTN